jgi:hypothetical protein
MENNRTLHSCDIIGDHLYILGGWSEFETPTEILNLNTNTWTTGPDMPENFDMGQAVTFQDTLFAISKRGKVYKLRDNNLCWDEIASVGNIGNRHVFPALILTADILLF